MNKKDLMGHYKVENDDDLYELLVQEKINELKNKEKKHEKKEGSHLLNSSQLKKMQKSFVVSIIDIVFLIGFIFAFTFLYLLFDNEIIPVVGGLVIAITLIVLKQQHFASLLMLPIPVFLLIGGDYVFTDIGLILLTGVTLGFLYYKQYENSFYHFILSIYLIIFFTMYDNIIGSLTALLILIALSLISWIKLKKYLITFIYVIGVYIFSLELIISPLSLIVYFGITLGLILVFVYMKNAENLIEKVFNEIVIILLNISVYIYLLFITIDFLNDSFNKLSIGILVLFFIIEIYIIYKKRIQDLGSYLVLNILIIFVIPFSVLYGLLEYHDNDFIVTIVSLVLFFVTIYFLEKRIEINKLFKFIMYYFFIFSIFFKLMIIDLDGLNGFVRLTLLFISSMIMLAIAIVSYLKNNKNDKKE